MPDADIPLFEIVDLHVSTVADTDLPAAETLKGVSLAVGNGEVHALTGPSESGTSTLASTLMAGPDSEVTSGRILFRGDDITDWATDMRAKAGLFLAFHDPQEIAGVSVLNFLRQSLGARKGIEMSVLELRSSLLEWMHRLDIDESFMERSVNEGSSGGEKKRNELLQMAIFEPEMAILDATEADFDTLRAVATGMLEIRRHQPEMGALVITNDQRLLDHLVPDRVHVIVDGRIVRSGGAELIRELETSGYDSFLKAA